MPQSIFLAEGAQFIDGVNQTYAPSGFWTVGTAYLGGSKAFVRRSLASFNVFGAATSGRALTPSDTLTAAELVLQIASFVGPSGWAATIDRITRTDWDYASADWTHYKTGALWTAAGGDTATPPAAVAMTSPSGSGEQVVAGMLEFVTDAIALRSGRVLLRVKANDEAPAQSQWAAWDTVLTSPTRPRLRVTYLSRDPAPIADSTPPNLHGTRAARPSSSASIALPSPAHPPDDRRPTTDDRRLT